MQTVCEKLFLLINWISLYVFLNFVTPSDVSVFLMCGLIVLVYAISASINIFIKKVFAPLISGGVFLACIIAVWYFWGNLKIVNGNIMCILIALVIANSYIGIMEWKRYYRHKKYELQPMYYVLSLIMYFYGVYKHSQEIMITALITAVLLIVLHFICFYMDGMREFIFLNKEILDLPVQNMKSSNGKMLIRILFFGSVVMMLAAFFRFDQIFASIGAYVVNFIILAVGKIFEFVDYIITMLAETAPTEPIQDTRFTRQYMEMYEAAYNPYLYKIAGLLVLAFIAFVATISIIRFFERGEKNKEEENIEIIGRNYTEKRERIVHSKLEALPWTEKGKIRRRYKKYVKKQMGSKLNPYLTAGEIKEKVVDDEIDGITREYEKARYGR